jgi:voltage-gated potassium channel Kch
MDPPAPHRAGFREWPLVAGLAALAAVLGYQGFARHFAAAGQDRTPFDLAYLTIQLFTFESGSVVGAVPWQLEVARLLAPAAAAYTALRGLALLFRDRLQGFKVRRLRDHVVVCGLGRKALVLVRALRERGMPAVVIERHVESDRIEACRAEGGLVVAGDGRSASSLLEAGLQRARALVAMTEDDAMNAEIVARARRIARPGGGHLRCVAHIVEPELSALLRARDLEESLPNDYLDYFNVFESGAVELLDFLPGWGDAEPDRAAHVLIAGVGGLGGRVLAEAALRWGLDAGREGQRLAVTLVDRAAEAKAAAFALKTPHLASVCDLRAAQLDFDSPGFYRGDFLAPEERGGITAAYVCTDGDPTAVAAALVLNRHLREAETPIAVRLTHEGGLAALLRGDAGGGEPLERIRPFGLLERTCTPELVLAGPREVLARAIHADYVRQALARGETPASNASMVPWSQLDPDLRESNRDQAAHIGQKLRAAGCRLGPLTDWKQVEFGFRPAKLEELAEMEHARWVAERERAGWRRAPTKDVARKLSPHLVPWRGLPEDVKDYDREFVRRTPHYLARAGLAVCSSASGN